MSVTIKLRRGVASEWLSQNIVLASGEPGYEIDTGRFKIGNGSTAWNSLSYASVVPTGILAGSGIGINFGTNGSTATISASGLNSSYISDFNEAVDDRIGSGLFVAGTGINLSYDDSGNSFTVSVTGLISNPTNNRILTSRDSTTTGIDAESNLMFDGSLLSVSGNLIANTGILDIIQFNTDNGSVTSQGQMAWNNTEGTVDIALTDSTVMEIGQHRFFRVRNTTGSPLYKGQVVYASGVHANGIITPNLYIANNTIDEIRFIGLIFDTINNNNNGYVIDFGHLRHLDLDGSATNYAVGDESWLDGDILYAHPTVAGKLTKVKPKHAISLAIILDNGGVNGQLFVRPTNFGDLSSNHDVNISGVTNGQFLQYNSSTDYWVASSSGNFTSLSLNGTAVSISGHTHTSSDITNFNSSVSGLLPTIANSGDNRLLTSTGTTTGLNAESNATFDGTILAVSGSITVDNLKLDGNTLSSTNSNGNIIISPSGTGALQRDSGGNARGQYSVDWQAVGSSGTMVAGGNHSVIGGGRNNTVVSTSSYSTIGGGRENSVSGTNSIYSTIGGGRKNSVSGDYSGYSTIGGGYRNDVIGTTSDHSTIGGGRDNSVSGTTSSYSTIGGGRENSVSGTNSIYSTIGGGRENSVSGDYSGYSTIGGGRANSLSGTTSDHSTIGGGGYNSVNAISSSYSTIGGGRGNGVSGTSSSYSTIGGGYLNSVSGTYSMYSTIGGGKNNGVSGTNSQYSTIPGGLRAAATRYGELCHAAGRFANNGDAQHTTLIARRDTSTATANQVLFLDGSSARLTLPAETTWTFTVKLSAYNDTDNQGGWWIFRGGIRRNAANGTALIGSLITESGFESSFNTASTSVVADDTNEALEIRVTGVASKNIRWVAVVDISQVSYGTP